MKILLITSGQPSLNPRLVKEADALVAAGHDVKVIYQYWNDWGTVLDQKLLAEKKWEAHLVGGNPLTGKFTYLRSRLFYKIATLVTKRIGISESLAKLSIGRCTPALIKKASSIIADIYIAHNLAALPAAVLAAKKNNALSGFDAEDFHRNEQSDDIANFDVKLKTYIEDKYIPQLDYLSTASPLISLAYQKLYPKHKPFTLLNVFPKQPIADKIPSDGKLKLFWFSQTIGHQRGIEVVIKAMGIVNNPKVELHLLGNCNDAVKTSFTQLAETSGLRKEALFFYQPIPADSIFNFASKFDIGLATEMSTPYNRDICLTNKIFTYVQSGLAVIASDTKAQVDLIEKYPKFGLIFKQDSPLALSILINKYLATPALLKEQQELSCYLGQNILNWENEQKIFTAKINELLPKPKRK